MSACIVDFEPTAVADDFRRAMRHVVGAISIITVGRGKTLSGMTVSSVSSLSVDPPSLIVTVDRASSSWPLLREYGVFGINILNADQIDTAERFSGKDGAKGAERFAGASWVTRPSGVHLLSGTLASIECAVEDVIERYSHAIVIGRVRWLQLSEPNAALAYWHGSYIAIDRGEDLAHLAEVSLPTTHLKRRP